MNEWMDGWNYCHRQGWERTLGDAFFKRRSYFALSYNLFLNNCLFFLKFLLFSSGWILRCYLALHRLKGSNWSGGLRYMIVVPEQTWKRPFAGRYAIFKLQLNKAATIPCMLVASALLSHLILTILVGMYSYFLFIYQKRKTEVPFRKGSRANCNLCLLEFNALCYLY